MEKYTPVVGQYLKEINIQPVMYMTEVGKVAEWNVVVHVCFFAHVSVRYRCAGLGHIPGGGMEDCVPGGAGVDETERESVEWDE